MILDTTTRKLELLLGDAVATNQLPFVASYVDVSQATFAASAAAETNGASNGATPVDVVPAPAAGTSRQLKSLMIFQADTAAAQLTVRLDDSGTPRILFRATLAVGDSVFWSDGMGWVVTDASGNKRTAWPTSIQYSQLPAGSGSWDSGAGTTITVTRNLKVGGTFVVTGLSTLEGNAIVGDGTGSKSVFVNAAAGGNASLQLQSAGVTRWIIRKGDTVAETGSDTGAPFEIRALTDGGSSIDTPVSIVRAAGGTITLARPVSMSSLCTVSGNGTHVFALPADATGNATAAVGRVPVLIGGLTKYLRYYND